MNNTFSLDTEAGALCFNINNIYKDENIVDAKVYVKLNKKYADYLPKEFPCRLYTQDIARLIKYLSGHTRELVSKSHCHSDVYMPLEGDFYLRALDGDVDSEEDGYFSILIMLNCGKIHEESSNNYFGFESVVDVRKINQFCSELKSLIP